MLGSDIGRKAQADRELGANCVAHARMFFNRSDFDLASAQSPTFVLRPDGNMVDALRKDYRAMSAMIFGQPPPFAAVVEAIAKLEQQLNGDQ